MRPRGAGLSAVAESRALYAAESGDLRVRVLYAWRVTQTAPRRGRLLACGVGSFGRCARATG